MSHAHNHSGTHYGRAFAIGVALNIGFVLLEAGFGWFSGSLALVADAGHNLSDVLGLLLAWGAGALARRRPSQRRTYGMRRASILAALANAVILLIAVGGIVAEALRRLWEPAPVAGSTVIWVALAGVLVNGVTAWLFMAGREEDLNIRGAFLHMAADTGVSLGVALAGGAILLTGWRWLDPAVSLAVAAVVLWSTWGLLRDSLNLALDAVPSEIELPEVRGYLARLPDVHDVHDLHVWAMSTTETALTAHLVVGRPPADNALIARACRELRERFDIDHVTLQFELNDPVHSCGQAAPEAV